MLVLVRHGETLANQKRSLQGKIDDKLSEIGRLQSHRIAKWASRVGIARILSSDSLRAYQTAQIIAKQIGLSPTVHRELRERDYGDYDGLTLVELSAARLEAGHRFVDPTQDWSEVPNVEGDDGVFNRVGALIESVYPSASPSHIILVTHAGVIKSYLHRSFAVPHERSNCFKVPPGAVLVLDYDLGGNLQLRSFYSQLEEDLNCF